MSDFTINYTADGDTIRRFMSSSAFVRGLQGPVGSGKSVACVMECLRLMLAQERSFDPKTVKEVRHGVFEGVRSGKRKLRIGVVRNTTPQLETTTMKTWLEWLPEDQFGRVRWRPPYKQEIFIPELDLEAEVYFLALDRDEDVRKLLSFEFTFIWLNEARELTQGVVTAAISRVRRFPRKIDGGATRACVIMDTNAPDEEHWWAIMSGQAAVPDWMSEEDRLTLVKPPNWEFFTQPPAVLDQFDGMGNLTGYLLNPDRENGRFTAEEYYTELLHGQTRDWIRNMLQNQIGRIFAGRPVYSGFSEKYHVAQDRIEPDPSEVIDVGLDFGLTPAAWIGQDVRGQVRALDEIVTRDMHTEQFAELLAKHLSTTYGTSFTYRLTGDPRGDDRQPNQEDATWTAFRIFAKHGLDVQKAWSNDPLIRIGAVQTQINTMVNGAPGYVISPNCTYLTQAKKGGYCYLKDGDQVDKKSIYSHISDAEQYAFLRMGYGKKVITKGGATHQQVQANRHQNLFARQGMTAKRAHQQSILSRGVRKS